MNIIFTVNSYYPCKDGVQAVTGYLAEGLVQRGHRVTVITCAHGNETTEEIHHGVEIHRVQVQTVHAMYRGDIEGYKKLVFEKAKSADVLVNVCAQHALTDVLLPELDNIPCKKVLYMHGMYDKKWHWNMINNFRDVLHKVYNNTRWGWYYRLSGKYFKKYDKVIQLHDFDAATLHFRKHYGIEGEVIENAAEDVFFERKHPVLEELPEKYAICVANYMDRKNQKFVLRAFFEADIAEDFELILIGSEDNSYYKELEDLKRELEQKKGKKKVRLLHHVPREATVEYIKNADVYLMGSKWEAFPISIVEAMAAGTPFVTTEVGCVKYLPGGIVVDTEADMTYWLKLLGTNEDVRKNLGKVGHEYAKENLSIASKVAQLEKILETVVRD